MDMAVANLFKHKMRLDLIVKRTVFVAPRCFERIRYFRFQIIENVESISLRDVYGLYSIFYESFILYAISKVLHEDRVIPIDEITIRIGVYDLEEGEGYELYCYRYNRIWDSPQWFSIQREGNCCEFPEHLVRGRFYPWINVCSSYSFGTLREEARFRKEFNYDRYWEHTLSIEEYLNSSNDEVPIEEVNVSDEEVYSSDEEEYTPPTKTYRQDCCVICLESKPNILYLYCMHIAVCDSCNRLKETGQYKCDVCRKDICERVKI